MRKAIIREEEGGGGGGGMVSMKKGNEKAVEKCEDCGWI